MTSQPGYYTITTHMLSTISQSEDIHTMKFGKLMECNEVSIFFKNHAKNETWRLVPVIFLFFKKALYEIKERGLQLSFHIIR